MELHPILYCAPIIVPQKRFTDIHGKPCAFLETNPSIHITPEGHVTLLVRCVDYRKFADKSFTLYQKQSNSVYFIGKTKLDRYEYLTADAMDFTELSVNYGLPKYPTYWTGPEDIRFLTENTIIATIPECNPKGEPSIFEAVLRDSQLECVRALPPSTRPEKNWMPIPGSSEVIYSLHPFTTKSLYSDSITPHSLPTETEEMLRGYHGSTNGILYKGQSLFLIHINRERTYHRWLLYNHANKSVKLSSEFTFFKHSYIEFTCSLASAFGRYFITCGVNDDKAFLLEVSDKNINFIN